MIENATFDLSSMLAYDAVVLQCHDNPDPDTVGSAFALLRFFSAHGVPSTILYGGYREISKPNMVRLIDTLRIPIRFVAKEVTDVRDVWPKAMRPLLITVDCQAGSSNVSRIACEECCVIDHHFMDGGQSVRYAIVNPYLGSCATLVWMLLCAAGFDLKDHPDISTALYYGLYTDTNSLSEIHHPVDLDMLDSLVFDEELIRQLKNNNITRDELKTVSRALRGAEYLVAHRLALTQAEPCDPNILGLINDLVRQVEGVDVCVSYCPYHDGIKLSIRSNSIRSVMANELSAFLTRGLGRGGGTMDKAGGFFRLPRGATSARAMLTERLEAYFVDTEVLTAGAYRPTEKEMRRYRKRKQMTGYVVLEEVCPRGTRVIVRTALGDVSYAVGEESYLLVGSGGDVRPIQRDAFAKCYVPTEETFVFAPEQAAVGAFYAPTIRETTYGGVMDLLPHVRACHPQEDIVFYIKPLRRRTKLFTSWYPEGYIAGNAGDYLSIRAKDHRDALIITPDVFHSVFEPLA